MRFWMALTAVLTLQMAGCSDENATADRAYIEQVNAQQVAEQRLMAEMATATLELERRISDWVIADNGILFVTEKPGEAVFSLHAMPASTPWHVSCDGEEIELTLGSWEEGTNRNARLLTRQLSIARFSEDQCKLLAAVVARKMLGITTPAKSP